MSNIPTGMVNGQGNFLVKHEYGDFFSDVQRVVPRIGDKGKESEAFVDRAYKQFHNHDFSKLAEIQDEFIASDPHAGTNGRPNNRNYNRMEYDYNERNDGKDIEDIRDEVSDTVELNVKNIVKSFKDVDWTLNNTASAVSDKPITQKDYEPKSKSKK